MNKSKYFTTHWLLCISAVEWKNIRFPVCLIAHTDMTGFSCKWNKTLSGRSVVIIIQINLILRAVTGSTWHNTEYFPGLFFGCCCSGTFSSLLIHADTLWNKTSLLKSRWWVRGRLQQTLALLLLLLLFLCYKVGGFYATEMFTGEVKILNIQSVKLKQRSLSTSGSRTGAEGEWSARWTARQYCGRSFSIHQSMFRPSPSVMSFE